MSIYAAAGCTLGIIPHLFISIVLSSLISRMCQSVFTIIQITGALYLLYMGIGMITSKPAIAMEQAEDTQKIVPIIRHGILINLLNPKLTLFFFSFLPQYLMGNSKSYIWQSFLLGIVFMLLTLILFISYGILSGTVKNFFLHSPKSISILQKCFGIIFIGFAVYSSNITKFF